MNITPTWYAKAKERADTALRAPLSTDTCSRLSIYLLQTDGTLWTIRYDGTPFARVRKTAKLPKSSMFYCACCYQLFSELGSYKKRVNPVKTAFGHWMRRG